MDNSPSPDWLNIKRIVRFGDTDSAGVIHFYQVFRWCHEAWEESLRLYGIKASEIFPNILNKDNQPSIALPIVHCEADFVKPIHTGDHLNLAITPQKINDHTFQVMVKITRGSQPVAQGLIRHQAINSRTRCSCTLSLPIQSWIESSSSK